MKHVTCLNAPISYSAIVLLPTGILKSPVIIDYVAQCFQINFSGEPKLTCNSVEALESLRKDTKCCPQITISELSAKHYHSASTFKEISFFGEI